jgi:uncharacterized protein (TIGR04255 family)
MPTRKILNSHRAPVIYTLAQVQFTPILKMAQFMPDIQEALRQTLPLLEEKQEVSIRFAISKEGPPQPQPTQTTSWQFLSLDRRTALYLRNNNFVFHSTAYKDFEDFFARMQELLAAVQNVVNIGVVVRYGLRYVDVFQTDEGGFPSRHFIPSLQGLSGTELGRVGGLQGVDGLNAKAEQRVNETIYSTAFGTMTVRMIESVGAVTLAPDLSATSVVVPNFPEPDPQKQFISLDIDHFKDGVTETFSMEATETAIRNLHIGTSAAFFAMLVEEYIDALVGQ